MCFLFIVAFFCVGDLVISSKFYLKNYIITERNLSIDDLIEADGFFITNAIHPVRWVKNFRERNGKTMDIFEYVLRNV